MNYISDIEFSTDKYVNISSFDLLVEIFNVESVSEKENLIKKYLIAAIVACIEGNVRLDIENNSWEIWVGEYTIKYYLGNQCYKKYLLLSLCKFIKCNNELYEYIRGYYNIWHQNNDKTEFTYDKYHLKDLEYNFYNLYNLFLADINKANEYLDEYVKEVYNNTYERIKDLFC